MKYVVILKRFWPDGTSTEIKWAPKKGTFDKFEDAAEIANQMNEHEWKFHQEHAGVRFNYVKEI